MKTRFYFFALVVAMLALGSCNNKENEVEGEVSKYITVSTQIGNMTRVTTDENGAQAFENNDKISVYAWTGDKNVVPAAVERTVNNSINTLTADGWKAVPQMLWSNSHDLHYFIGVHPMAENAVDDLTRAAYTFNVDQQTESDLLVAVNTTGLSYNENSRSTVPLEFTHVMSKLIVELTYKNQWGKVPTVEKVVVSNVEKEATVNYLTKEVTPATSTRENISLPKIEANIKYASIIIPQDEVKKITIVIDGKDFVYESGVAFKFESGKFTTIKLEVGRDEIKLSDVSISNWKEGETIDDGEALD